MTKLKRKKTFIKGIRTNKKIKRMRIEIKN
jgi:hypothetical protein